MGKELEIKLAAPGAAALDAVCSDAQVEALRCGSWQEICMETTYLDTPARAIAARKWMLRRRVENGEAIYTMKTPGDGYVRGEWESRKAALPDAVREMVSQGAPAELAALTAGGAARVCGVQFSRKTVPLRLADGTMCALCADRGHFLGGAHRRPFCEVELELTSGSAEAMLAFARALAARYDLREEPNSKFVRAAALAAQDA